MASHRYLIVGGGPAAGYALEELLKRDLPKGQVGLVSADSHVPYDRPPLSKAFLQGTKEARDTYIIDPDTLRASGVRVYLNSVARRLDIDKRTVETHRGERIEFEKLLLATGSHVNRLAAPGADDADIHYLRFLSDAERIREHAKTATRPLVIGGGYIGTEVAASLTAHGVHPALVYRGQHLLSNLFTPKMAEYYEQHFRTHRVDLRPEQDVIEVIREGNMTILNMKSGETMAGDLVVAGIGVSPAVELCEGTAIEIDDGIVVDGTLETSVPGIYAAGDVARYPDPVFKTRRRLAHWQNAVDQGKLAAHNMLGDHETYTQVPYFFSDAFDLSWEFWGDRSGADEAVHVGDFHNGSFSVWWTADGIVKAAFVLNRIDEERRRAKLCVEEQKEISRDIHQRGEAFALEAASPHT